MFGNCPACDTWLRAGSLMRILTVSAVWDDEADVWVAVSDDVPGLVTEADTFPELRAKLLDLIPELLAENGHLIGQSSFST
jgi:hypothetical protein